MVRPGQEFPREIQPTTIFAGGGSGTGKWFSISAKQWRRSHDLSPRDIVKQTFILKYICSTIYTNKRKRDHLKL